MKIAFYKGWSGSPWNRVKQAAVRAYTFSKYSHCEIIIGEVWYGAVTKQGVRANISPKYSPSDWDIYTLKGYNTNRVKWRLRSKLGLPYDWAGIFFSIFIPLGIHKHKGYFCSEYLAMGLGLPKANTINPKKLFKLCFGRS